MKLTRTLALVVALIMALGFTAFAEIDMSEKLSVTILTCANYASAPGTNPPIDSRVEQALEEKFNLDITVAPVDWYNGEQRNIYIAGDNAFDLAISVGVEEFMKIGAVRTISRDMIAEYAPKMYAELLEYDGGDMWKSVEFDGEIYGIPEFQLQTLAGYMMICRSDWMETLGFAAEDMQTLEDFEELFLAVRNDDPDGNGEKDTYAIGLYNPPFGETTFGYWFAYYGVHPFAWTVKDGEAVYSNVTEEYKQALELLARWYELEIIDPDFVTDPRANTLEKFANGKTFSFEAFAGHIASNGTAINQLKAADPDATWTWLAAPENEEGKHASIAQDFYKGTCMFFGKDTSDEKVARLMAMLDYITCDYEGALLALRGFEGESFVKNEDNTISLIGDYATSVDLQNQLGIVYFVPQYSNQTINSIRDAAERTEALNWAYENLDAISVNYHFTFSDDAKAASGDADTLVKEYFFDVVTGKVSLEDTWDSYVADWYAKGGEILTDEANEQLNG